MNILILGSGGRECAFAWKISQSPDCDRLYIAPGNAGTADYGENVDLKVTDFNAIRTFVLEHEIQLVLPGSEDPLVAGIYDYFKADPDLRQVIVAGPSKAGAQLEGSKAFAKAFMDRHHIPTAAYREFTAADLEEGKRYLQSHPLPIVLKADGLAAGKGVVITEDRDEAVRVFEAMLSGSAFGTAGEKVVIEAFLSGIECSVFVLTDGEHYHILPEAKDYKRIGEGDKGLNTGGMGAVSPVPFVDMTFLSKVRHRIIDPTVRGLKKEGITYKGFIFFGLINVEGDPFVIEYNCRMGDPETEVVLPRLKSDLVELLVAMENGALKEQHLEITTEAAATVMLVSAGYPESYEKGKKIEGLERLNGELLFHAGTRAEGDEVLSNGGRVIAVSALGSDIFNALKKCYGIAAKIDFEGKQFRRDIGYEFSR